MRRPFSLLAVSLALFSSHVGASPVATTAPACDPVTTAMQGPARAALLKQYQPRVKGYTLVTQFPSCTSVAGPVTEVTFETGFGHSLFNTIGIYELKRSGSTWNVTLLEMLRGKGTSKQWGGESSDGVRVTRGTLTAVAIEDAVTLANAVLDVTLSEKAPSSMSAGGGWGSSGDFYSALTLLGQGKVERRFAGYEGSTEQLTYLPIRVAVDKLNEAVPDKALSQSTFDAPARALFSARFLAEAPRFDDQFHWWVREAYLRAAGDAGDVTLLPKLHEYAKRPTDVSSNERSRVEAISAIATITGDDRRFDAKGAERPVDDVAKDYTKKPAKKP